MRGLEQIPWLYDTWLAISEAFGLKRWRPWSGELRMLEHVRSTGDWGARWQDLVQPLWTRMAGGCHPNRDTESTVREAGSTIDAQTHRAHKNMRRFAAHSG